MEMIEIYLNLNKIITAINAFIINDPLNVIINDKTFSVTLENHNFSKFSRFPP